MRSIQRKGERKRKVPERGKRRRKRSQAAIHDKHVLTPVKGKKEKERLNFQKGGKKEKKSSIVLGVVF